MQDSIGVHLCWKGIPPLVLLRGRGASGTLQQVFRTGFYKKSCMQELTTVAEHRLGRAFRSGRTLVRDQQALASAALAALTRAAEEARTATTVQPPIEVPVKLLRTCTGSHALMHGGWHSIAQKIQLWALQRIANLSIACLTVPQCYTFCLCVSASHFRIQPKFWGDQGRCMAWNLDDRWRAGGNGGKGSRRGGGTSCGQDAGGGAQGGRGGARGARPGRRRARREGRVPVRQGAGAKLAVPRVELPGNHDAQDECLSSSLSGLSAC